MIFGTYVYNHEKNVKLKSCHIVYDLSEPNQFNSPSIVCWKNLQLHGALLAGEKTRERN